MIGQTLGHYKILGLLGKGGMGEVYRAEDTTLDREVALKILPREFAESQERLDRFQREAKTLAALDHPNIVTAFSVEHDEDVHFLTMQLVEGKRLSDLIPKGGMPLERIFDIAIPLADALAAAHEKGVIHRDLKPANIMLSDDGRVKVLDFGLAKLRPDVASIEATELPTEPLTEEGRIMGTMPYMSPEQLEGKAVDARSDIFSLGVVLYEVATGERPFKGDTSVSLIMSIGRDTPPEVDTLREEIPHHLGRVIAHCLEKNLKRRFQSALDVHNELEALRKEVDSGIVQASSTEAKMIAPPRGRRWWPVLAAVAVVVLATAALWIARTQGPTAKEAQFTSLAVLPLRDLAGDPSQEYFVDGMTEALITNLAKISSLKVISRTSMMRYKQTDKSIPEIAEELGVDALIEGSVLRASDEIRITVQLIDGRTDEHLWAEDYQRNLADLLALQSEISLAVADEVRATLTSEEEARATIERVVDPEAHEAYLKGRYYWNRRNAEGFEKALGYFEQAIDEDPVYAPAYAGLAATYALLGCCAYDVLPAREAMPKSRQAAHRALELDDTLAEAHTTLAWVTFAYDWNSPAAEEMFLRAIEFNPSNATAHHWYALLLISLERWDEALKELARARELSPLSPIISNNLGWLRYVARQFDQAVEQYQSTLEMSPGFAVSHLELGNVYLAMGRYEEAIQEYEEYSALTHGSHAALAHLAYGYARLDSRDASLAKLEELRAMSQERHVPAYYLGLAYLGLEEEEAFVWLERSYEERSYFATQIRFDALFDPLRDHPRFQALLEKYGQETPTS